MRKTGIEVIGDVPWGTHFCQFYKSQQDLLDILVPYFRAGLESNEACTWVTCDPLGAPEARALLARAVPDLAKREADGQIEFLDYRQWYKTDGPFDAERVLRGWVLKCQAAAGRGFDGLRFGGDASWPKPADGHGCVDHGATLDRLVADWPLLALCAYPLDHCGAFNIIEVVASHQFALIEREGRWQVVRSANLEHRLAQRTAELAARQEQLRQSQEQARLLAAIVESSDDAVTGKTLQGVITSWNRAAERIYGYRAEEVIGKSVAILVAPDRPNELREILEKIRQGQRVEHYATVRVRKDGRCIEVLLTVSPIKDDRGHVIGASVISRDVSQRKRLEEELRGASQYARSLIEASLDPLVTISPLGKITDVNKATELATGLSRQELIGSDFSRYFTQPQKANAGYQKVISDGFVRDYPLTIRHVSGRTTDVLYNASVYRDEGGQVQGVFAAARDVTERMRIEEELRLKSLYARSLIEASLDPLVTISPEGKITDVNTATEQATGVPRERLIASDFSAYFTEPDEARQGYQTVIAKGVVRDYPLTIRHVSGHTMDVLYNATVYKDQSGRVQGVFAAARDITERQAAEKRQAATNALLELFARKTARKEYLDSVAQVIQGWSGCQSLGIRVVDAEGNIPYESRIGFDHDFCYAGRDLSTRHDTCLCVRAITQQLQESDLAVNTPGGSFRCDDAPQFVGILTAAQRGNYRGNCIRAGFTSLAVIPIRYRDQVLGVIHLGDPRPQAISPQTVAFIESMAPLIGEAMHRFNAEAELARHREHLEDLVRERTQDLKRSNDDLEQFAYVASHDLQEPLRAVAGFVALLQRRYQGKIDAKADEYISLAVDGAARMQSLIRDLLAYSRVGTTRNAPRPTDAQIALNAALTNLRATIEESAAVVEAGPLPTIQADQAQLTQLFQNLVGNAIKFRGPQPPRIHVAADRQPEAWDFSVRDNGIGIETQYAERIFLIFQRLHTRSAYPGTGIGLAICKKIVERHGGKIWVESKPGAGATFHFTIPHPGEHA